MSDNYNSMGGVVKANSTLDASGIGGAVSMGDCAIAAIVVPASMVGTSVTFQVSVNDSTYVPLKDASGNNVSVTIGSAAAFHSMKTLLPLGCAKVKPVSSSTSDVGKIITVIGQRIV